LSTCPTCGANNAFDSKFCSQCATTLGGGATPVDPGAPRAVNMPPPAYGAGYGTGMPMGYEPPRSSNATTILVLGILSLVVCAVMGPIAWWMGKSELSQMDAGLISNQDRGTVNAGYICGIIGTVLMGISLLMILFVFGMAASH
jgi:hypothetical protein